MKKIFTLSTCNTSKRILDESGILNLDFEIQDIKKEGISEEELLELKNLVGTYDTLFSRRAQKYKALNLKNVDLREEDIKNYILEDYTFLKRPVIVDGENIFVGNAKKVQNLLSNFVREQRKEIE